GVAGQHGIDLDLRRGCQMAVGDECRDLVAKVTPGIRRIRGGQQRAREKGGGYRFHHHGTVRPRISRHGSCFLWLTSCRLWPRSSEISAALWMTLKLELGRDVTAGAAITSALMRTSCGQST